MNKKKGVIYYTDFSADSNILKICKEQIKKNFRGEIVSVSLNKSIDLGKNIIFNGEQGVTTMFKQILTALEAIIADYVFFTEHDVLYHETHFDFNPPRDDIFYYNTNVWQWKYLCNFVITYKDITSLSGLCVNRKLAIEHYKKRLKLIERREWKDDMKNPYWARVIGYEPGVKSRRQQLISKDDKFECRKSEYPNIDIRHSNTLTPIRVKLKNFKHQPKDWRQDSIDNIPGWNLRTLFNL